MSSDRIKDLEKDLEATRQWAIAAENELTALRAMVVEERAKLEAESQYWYETHMKTLADLQAANHKAVVNAKVIAELTMERDTLYASFN